MAYIESPLFRFASLALPADALGVVDFKGNEGLSTFFEFEINLVSTRADLDLAAVLAAPASFSFVRGEEDIPVHGVLKEFHQLHTAGGFAFYHATLVPKLWLLTLTQQNQVFLDNTVPEILEELLLDAGLESGDCEFRLSRKYAPWEYVCQFRESHYNFFSRWLEREGAYFYFEHTKLGAKCVITDSKNTHRPMSKGERLRLADQACDAAAPTEGGEKPLELRSFICRQRTVPGAVRLRDDNYLLPSSELSGAARISEAGRGALYFYGENFRTPSEANNLAKIRAEEYKCQERRFYAQSQTPSLRPGFTFSLEGHLQPLFNRAYLTVQIVHRGSQTALLDPAIQACIPKREIAKHYDNSFSAIPDDIQFRPERAAIKPRFFGGVSARIDAAGDERTADVDELGRYKVILPFDESGRGAGKASGWLRLMLPYAGRGYGMHFPLRKGAEVVLGFTDGDPDRPYIAGAMPATDGPGGVNPAEAAIVTAGGNTLRFVDAQGEEAVLLTSPRYASRLRLGAPEPTPPAQPDESGQDLSTPDQTGVLLSTDAGFSLDAATMRATIHGPARSTVEAERSELTVGRSADFALGGRAVYSGAPSWELTTETTRIATEERTLVESKFDALAEQQRVLGHLNEVMSNHSAIKAEALEAVGACCLIRGSLNQICGASVQNAATALTVANTQIAAIGNEIKASRTSVETTGSLRREVGQLVETVQTATLHADAVLRSARLAVESAELHCDRSDIIMHG